jgi:hypothetical protein
MSATASQKNDSVSQGRTDRLEKKDGLETKKAAVAGCS